MKSFSLLASIFANIFTLILMGWNSCSTENESKEIVTSFVVGRDNLKEKEYSGSQKVESNQKSDESQKTDSKKIDSKPEGIVVIGGAGDVIFHGRVKSTADYQMTSPSAPEDSRYEGWWHIFKQLEPVVKKTDIALVNLESPIARERKKATGRPPVLNGPASAVKAMREAGFSIFNIANNHAFDQMREGVQETCEAVKEAKGDYIGGGPDRATAESPVVKEINGLKIAFLGWTLTLNKNFNEVKTDNKPWIAVYTPDGSISKIKGIRSSVDVVVVSMHWGAEFSLQAGSREKEIAKKLCSAGADIILGHGPHILHPVEIMDDPSGNGRKCVVAYSLGNLLSNQGLKYRYGWNPPNLIEAKNIPYTRDGIILRVHVSKKEGKVVFNKVEATAIWTENNWLERYAKGVIPPDDIFIVPIVPYFDSERVKNDEKLKLLLMERLSVIKKMVGSTVTWSDL